MSNKDDESIEMLYSKSCLDLNMDMETNILFKITIIILIYLVFLFTATTRYTVYRNAQFDPIDRRYIINSFSSISSAYTCLCQCYNNVICFIVTYFGSNQTCLLFFAQLSQGKLRVVPTIANAKVYYFGNRSFNALKLFNRSNETVYAIWNTMAGGDSSPKLTGEIVGTYYPGNSPETLFDSNMTTEYTNYGSCSIGYSSMSITCGENTGWYLSLGNSFFSLVAFYVGTNTNYPQRDPLTITIEGSNLHGDELTFGRSWTLIYNGSTGLVSNLGRSTLGALEIIQNFPIPFANYRVLVTSKRGIEICTSYTEFMMIGY
ncbi:unnamed protein product [Rotaria sp. Silwood1]|nr:unnamed protein product [Rotaria sp. Silwood1]CAF1095298.1 unnamed protein product [Rotaria sp. Silwood1]